MKWDEKYAIGIDKIDEQHKRLFAIAQETEDLLDLPSRVDKYDDILKLIDELKDYVNFHFSEEEKVMKEIEYKKYFTHCIHHHDFVIKIRKTNLKEIDEHQEEQIRKLLDLVNNWLVAHVMHEDRLWAAVYKEKNL